MVGAFAALIVTVGLDLDAVIAALVDVVADIDDNENKILVFTPLTGQPPPTAIPSTYPELSLSAQGLLPQPAGNRHATDG